MMGSRLLWAVIVGFLSGVFLRSALPLGLSYAALALLQGSVFLICGYFDPKRRTALTVTAVALAAFGFGIVRMDTAVLTGDPMLTQTIGTHVALIGTVTADPDVRDTGVRISIHATELMFASSSTAVSAGVLAQLPSHTTFRYGDTVRLSGILDLPTPFDTQSGKQFDYPEYLGASGISYVLSFAKGDVVDHSHGNPLVAAIFDLKHRYLDGLDAVLPEPDAGLAAGITVGDKRSIGPELSSEFQKVGLMQLVVLSGYNITVVANAAAQALSWTSRYVQFSSGIGVVIFFILISGGASSAVRAGLMAAIAMYARIARRTFDPLRALGVASLAMTLWNPFTLAFDPGFQLSAVAMAGLTTITPIVSSRMQWITERFGLREIISSTIATQCAVLPLLLYQSGQLSIYSVPANILAMIPVPMAMLMSLIGAIGGMLFGSGIVAIGLPAHALLSYIIAVAQLFSSMPLASVAVGRFGFADLAFSYAALGIFASRYQISSPREHGDAPAHT